MATDKDDRDLGRYPKDPPEDWRSVHRAIDRMDQSWPIIKPIVAWIANWKALMACTVFYVILRSEELLAAVTILIGGLK